MPIALEQFVKQLEDSGVIAPGKLENFVPPKAQPKDAQELARQLVQSKHLTKFQAQEIYAGRAKSLILGNYTILDKIGAGGMGQVFKAEHRRMHRVVAIKMLPKNVTQDAAAAARFQREVEAASKLLHPNIVSAFDADEAGGVHFLAMEFVEGSDLSALVKKNGPLPIATAVNYTLQAAKGLEFAHGEGVVHRDIKPANLLLDKKGTVKILDMGLARISTSDDAATQAELTGTGAVLGTVDYMAPEQALSTKHADARADIYSLGCSLHYLVSGKATYAGETLMAKLLAHREKPIPTLGADAPEQLQAVFEKMVAKNVEDRYQSMSEVVADLQECVAASSTIGKSQTISEPPSADANLSFLAEATAHTQHHKPTKLVKSIKDQPDATKKGSGSNRKKQLLVVGGSLAALVLLAGIVIKMQTKDGTLVVEINQPDAVVQVLDAEGKKIEIEQPGGKGSVSISVDPGKHRLKVEKNGFQFFAKDFEMESGGTQSIKATLEPVEAVAGQTDKRWNTPAFQQWLKHLASLSADKQVDAVVAKLQEFNPGFDGKVTGWDGNGLPKIENGVVTELRFLTDDVTDISPVRALNELHFLYCSGSSQGKRRLSDLSPLRGMKLVKLDCGWSQVADLSPLKEMKLTHLACGGTQVSDLSPLEGMPLTSLVCGGTNVSDLSPLRTMPLTNLNFGSTPVSNLLPLKGMHLTDFNCGQTKVSDLSPLKGMPLRNLGCSGTPVSDLSPLQGMRLTGLDCFGTKVSDLSPLHGMPLTKLDCDDTQVSSLQPLQGMPLTLLHCPHTPVSDLSPLIGMDLTELYVTPNNIIKGIDVIRQMKSLATIGIDGQNKWPPAEFWKKYDAGVFGKPGSTAVSPDRKPITTFNDPAFQLWMKTVAAMPAEKQVVEVATKLHELNPDFNGTVNDENGKGAPKIENGVVTRLGFLTDNVTDISPVRALAGLKGLRCSGSEARNGKLSDFSPLQGMRLTKLFCGHTQVSDLSPLKGMMLTRFECNLTKVSNITPLQGMPLVDLWFTYTQVSDLSPLRGMPLTNLGCDRTQVSDLSPLQGMNLTNLAITPKNITKGIDVVRQIASLTTICTGGSDREKFPAAEFWKKYDAGEFGKPDFTRATPNRKPITNISDPAFQQWMKAVAAMPAEKQVDAVAKKLQQLNPGFDGKVGGWNVSGDPKIEAGVVTELGFITDNVTDISPVRALVGLKMLKCYGSPLGGNSKLSDLSPLKGLQLTHLNCDRTQVADLSHLIGMPLTFLSCGDTSVSNLVPLTGMKLARFCCDNTNVSDLTPLKRMPLTILHFDNTKVDDVSPLEGMKLREVSLTPGNIHTGLEILRRMQSLQQLRDISSGPPTSPKLFWKKYAAGDSADEETGAPFLEFDGPNGFSGSRGFPDDALTQLKTVTNQKKGDLNCIAFTPGGDWVLLFDGDGFSTNNPNLPACRKLAELQQPGLNFRCVAFAPGGGWTILWNQNGNWTQGGASGEAFKKTQELVKAGSTLRSIAYGPGGAWVLMYDEIGVAYGQVPNDLAKVLDNAVKKGANVLCVAFTGSDWICLTTGGWWTNNLNLPAARLIERRIKLGYSPKWIAVKPKVKQ